MSRALAFALAVFVALVVLSSTFFSVSQTQEALVLRLGEPVPGRGIVVTPGLHVKIPFVENVVKIDRRLLSVETPSEEVPVSDNQRLDVDAFARYRIVDPLLFFKSVRDEANANAQLRGVLNSEMRRVLGEASISDIVRDRREPLMNQIRDLVNATAQRYGVTIVDVRVRRADLPPTISNTVYSRMATQRQVEAAQFRALGSQASQEIKAKADRDATVIVADAQQKADTIRGQGDAERAQVFADAYGKDPAFFAFYRSMNAYKAALGGANSKFLLAPGSDFFRFFGDPTGGKPAAAPAAAATN
ncbi:MAG: protease modulator HflC [Hyphomicrobiales bacterium]|nr:protease modulator HflC [Hyphomicrobiales bacterium]